MKPLGLPRRTLAWALGLGVVVGLVYTLSPLTVWFFVAMPLVVRWALKDLPSDERRWVAVVLVVSIALRVAAIAALFLATDHGRVPFGSFFGDEEYFIKRAWWLRNVAIGIPIHRADLIYAFDEYSRTSYLYGLAFINVLVGPTPYGAHLCGVALYVTAVAMLFRVVRESFGRGPAFGGLVLLLGLPSLFAWSVSALKEPLYILLTALSVQAAMRLARSPRIWRRLVHVVTLVALAVALESIRAGGLTMVALGVGGGLAAGAVLKRPRLALVAALVVPLGLFAVWKQGDVQIRAWRQVRQFAGVHWGHINTPGYSYKLLDDRLYEGRFDVDTTRLDEGLRYLARAAVSYIVVPLPWNIQSRAALAYLPEQMVWYVLLTLIPFGLIGGLRRDALLTAIFVMYASATAAIVALTGGNVGTLVRHRGLAFPYLAWLATSGAWTIAGRLTASRPVADRLASLAPAHSRADAHVSR